MNLASSAEATKTTIKTGGFDAVYRAKKANATVAMASEVGAGRANETYLEQRGFRGVSDNTATLTSQQNLKTDATASSAREEFGDVAGGNGTHSFRDASYQMAQQSHRSMAGSADAYKKESNNGKSQIAYEQAFDKTQTDMQSYNASIKNLQNKEGMSREEARGAIVTGNASANAEKMTQTGIVGKTKREQGIINQNATISDMSYLEGLSDQTTKETMQGIGSTQNYQKDFNTAADEQLKKAQNKASNQSRSKYDVLLSPSAMWNAITGKESYSQLNERLKTYNQDLQNGLSDTKELTEAVKNGDWEKVGELSAFNKIDMVSGGISSSFNSQRGFLQGGSQSGVSYSHNESSNYSSGTNVNAGSVFAGMAQGLGMSMGTYGSMTSSMAAAGAIMGAGAMMLPGGRMAGMLSDIGAISPESSYAMGVGAHTKMLSNEAKMAESKMASGYKNLEASQKKLSTSQKQYDWAKEQAAESYSPVGSDYIGWNSQQLGAESARLQQGIHQMNGSVTRLGDMRSRLIRDGMQIKHSDTISLTFKNSKYYNTIGNLITSEKNYKGR